MLLFTGIGIYIRNLLPQLVEEYEVVALGRSEDLKRYEWFNKISVIEADFPIYSVKEQLLLPLLIPESDLFIAPHYNIPLMPLKAKKRLTVVHDVNHLVFLDTLSTAQKIYAKVVMHSAVRLSDKIITVSEFSKSEIIKYTGAPESKITAIHFGIDRSKYEVSITDEKISEVRNKYRLPERFFFYIGTFNRHKNLKGLLEAYRIYLKKTSDSGRELCKLVIAGKIDTKHRATADILSYIENDALLSRQIVLSGFIEEDELPLFYHLAAGFVFPTLYEGFGTPPLEAMSCGCPVAASSIPSVNEICGDSVLKFNPEKPEDIAEKLQQLSDNEELRKDLVEKGFLKVGQYSWRTFGEKFISELKNIL
jgi:glycosyltransferase involved in cell wall biosynthesis